MHQVVARITNGFSDEIAQMSADIWRHYEANRQDVDVFERKMQVRSCLFSIARVVCLRPLCFCHSYCVQSIGCEALYAVGSTVNGCGSFNSDMDLCAIVPLRHVRNERRVCGAFFELVNLSLRMSRSELKK